MFAILLDAMLLDAMLADLRAANDEKYGYIRN